MSRLPQQHRVTQALGSLCNGTLDAQEGKWLEEQLASVEVRALYVDYMTMHACLYAESSTSLAQPTGTLAEELLSVASAPLVDPASSLNGGGWIGSLTAAARWRPRALAAAVALVALFSSLMANSFFSGFDAVKPALRWAGVESGSADRSIVARITGSQNCRWKHSSASLGYGSELVAGQELQLLEGLAEITFEDGATVLLESPAKFVVDAPHRIHLHDGRLAAVVPRQSRGFRVHTRTLEVFDVGAEFGLLAKQSGVTELHVFNGLVKADILDASGHLSRTLELNANEAARVNPVSTTVLEFPANQSAFVRNMLPTNGPHDGLLAYDGFDYPEGQLAEQNGGFGWAGPWFNLAADAELGPDSNCVLTGSLATKGIAPLGNRAAQIAQENRTRRSLATSVGSVFDVAGMVENQDGVRLVGRDGKQIYVSFLQRVSELDGGFYGLELHRGDGNANRVLCIGNGAEGTGYGATSNYNIYGNKNFPSLGVENTEANFIVVKITFGVGNRDTLEVFRNPKSLRDEGACKAIATLKGNFAFDRISLGNFDGSKIHEVDELRVGTHFLAVTGRWGGERGRLLRRTTLRLPVVGRPLLLAGQQSRKNRANTHAEKFVLFARMVP